jgi:acyl-CoA thioesterase-1
MVVGDSLSAAFGIAEDAGWVALLQARLRDADFPHRVVNASVTGDTTAGALTRLPAALADHQPELVVLELGGNDGLRGLSLKSMRENLTELVRLSHEAGARVLLLGMQLPPNYGAAYTTRFAQVFGRVAESENAALVPFFLEGVAETLDMMQADGIHPAEEAQPRMLDNVWPKLEPLLRR